ncbi:3-dehydroquinate synthase [Chitinophaga japonensis]|uniref:3-dehydroquinate synthase n=1 Tax=Chitinophaga japonensis TaxID=104662 RepID=A0A562TCT9_CHIJA|nr:3-dehydroquinate synthase [Chitinophaga japonensis]TWI91088.1 3-dehydroquinate synthase [Chitinophaga japonensis]
MYSNHYIQQSFQVSYAYRVFFTSHLFDPANTCLKDYLQEQASGHYRKRLLVVADEGVWQHHPYLQEQVSAYLQAIKEVELAAVMVIPGGEAAKNDEALFFRLADAIDQHAIDRHSFVIGIGGGSVLDLVGFAAAVSHRGVRHIRIPTTVLSQNDSGVGVKNGINFHGKKNFLGAFAPPAAVFNDAHFLTTLDARDWRSGMVEAVKVALIKDAAFFEWMEEHAAALTARNMEAMEELVHRCAALHMAHIGGAGDPFESGSSRPLDFGHWSAHKLEQLTDFSLRHGEAVSIGIALDSVYSSLLGWLDQAAADRILHLLQQLELPLYHPLLDMQEPGVSPLVKGLEEFREHLGGRLTICLLKAIGQGAEVNNMDTALLQKAGERLKELSYAY